MTEACHEVVVHHADRLHEGIDDGRPAKFEAAARKLLRDLAGKLGLGRYLLDAAQAIDLGAAVDEVPQELREARAFVHDREPGARGKDRPLDLETIAHDALVLHQSLDLFGRVASDLGGFEGVEGAAEIIALAQDGDPGEAGLEAVENELLEKRAVVVLRHAPFLVVIGDVERILPGPGAAWASVTMCVRVHRREYSESARRLRARTGRRHVARAVLPAALNPSLRPWRARHARALPASRWL